MSTTHVFDEDGDVLLLFQEHEDGSDGEASGNPFLDFVSRN